MPSDSETRAQAVGKWLLALLVPGSAMAIGTLHAPTLIVVALLAAISCVLLWVHPPRRMSGASRWVVIAFAVLMVATILQAVPLPAGAVSIVAPANADVWARSLTPLREAGPAWHPISVAPPATHVEILKGALYGCIFLAALRVTFLDGGSRFLESIVIASACLIALTTLAHTAVEAEQVFGFYRPRETHGYYAHRIGPLLNPNHVAAYCNVGALVAVGVALQDRGLAARALSAGAALLLAGTSVWAGSRGGTGSLLVGAVLLVTVTLFKRSRVASTRRAELMITLGAFLAAAGLIGVSASDIARADLAGRDVAKIEIVRRAFRLVPLSPIFGFGRGAFETMFPVVREDPAYFTFVRAENIGAQWMTEWGVPVAVAGLVLLAVALRPTVVLRSDRPAVGCWTAVVASVLHELVDFHLEVPAVVVLVAACVAVVVGSRAERAARRGERSPARLQHKTAFVAAAVTVFASVVVAFNVDHSLSDDRDRIAKLAVDQGTGRDAFVKEVRSMMLRYPAEPFIPLAGAVRARVEGESVVPWVGRALERYPNFGRAHLVLARSLAARHRAQARLEYRLAYEDDVNLHAAIEREAPYLVDDVHSALDIVPDGVNGLAMLEMLGATLRERLPATAVAVDEELLRREPVAPGPHRRRVRAAISDLSNNHPWCSDRGRCVADALSAAEALIAREPDKCEPRELRARLLVAAGEVPRALDTLSRDADVVADRAACLRVLAHISLENGDRRRVDDAVTRVTNAGCGSSSECLELYSWASSFEESRGNLVRAVSFAKRAADLSPSDDQHLVRIAELATRAGLTGEAREAYRKLAVRHPDDERWRTRAEELRTKANDDRFRLPP